MVSGRYWRTSITPKHTVFMEAYILSDTPILHALERAAAQGVTVFVLLEHRRPWAISQRPRLRP